ncbi:ABC transporter permease [Pseudonocardia nantongensis]|uniref:ABC transporter permease n=1 Tax=Pseudonocardia nantongensis TaxID=1181885 RepID=UPI00397979F7
MFGGSSLQWFLSGVVVMITMFGTSMTGANLQFEIMTGAFERMLATPLSRSSLMIGRALKELQAAIVTLVAVPFGFALYPLHVLAGLVLLGIFGVGVGALSYELAIAARKTEWIFWVVQQSLLFPLLILSGMMLPLETGPEWMRIVSLVNPLTYIVDAERALFAGTLGDPAVLWGIVAALVTAAVGLTVGVRSIRGATI